MLAASVDGGRGETRFLLVEHRDYQVSPASRWPSMALRCAAVIAADPAEHDACRWVVCLVIFDGLQRSDRLPVRVEPPPLFSAAGFRHEMAKTCTPAERSTDHAAARCDVHDVELVDHRRHHQQAPRTPVRPERTDQLELLGPVDHRPRGGRDRPPSANASGSTIDGTPRRRQHVGDDDVRRGPRSVRRCRSTPNPNGL